LAFSHIKTLRDPVSWNYSPKCLEGKFSELVCRMPHAPLAGHPMVGLRLLGSSRSITIYGEPAHKVALGRIRVIASGYPLYGGGVVRSFDPGSVTRGTACLTSVCPQGDLMAVEYGQGRRLVETTFFGYRDV
jgi:hypothetical protein